MEHSAALEQDEYAMYILCIYEETSALPTH